MSITHNPQRTITALCAHFLLFDDLVVRCCGATVWDGGNADGN